VNISDTALIELWGHCLIADRRSKSKGYPGKSKVPHDWREQVLRHIEAKKLEKHPQTSCPGDPCQDDIFISGQPNYSSATLSHKDVPPDSLMKVGVQEINEDISLNLFYSF